MVKIQINLPNELNEKISIESIKSKVGDKRIVIINALEKYFKER